MHLSRDNISNCLCSAFYACSQTRVPTKLWYAGILVFTLATTTCMIICVCTDEWEVISYDLTAILNLTNTADINGQHKQQQRQRRDQCLNRVLRPLGSEAWYLESYNNKNNNGQQQLLLSDPSFNTTTNRLIQGQGQDQNPNQLVDPVQCEEESGQTNAISLVLAQRGSAFRLCWDVQDEDEWANISALCAPMTMDRCLVYDKDSVKQPFCCVQCLYTVDEVTDLHDDGQTTFEPIFTVIGFLIVSLIVVSVCHVLAVITMVQRIVPVVMVNGILFLVSGAFMAFCLVAHEYKINSMNTLHRRLPHMSWEMIHSASVRTSWSVDVGWMGVAFSALAGILWIRLSYHLASDAPAHNKVKPTVDFARANSISTTNANAANNNNASNANVQTPVDRTLSSPMMRPPSATAAVAPAKTVRWATNPHTNTTIVANSRPDSGTKLLPNNECPTSGLPTPSTGMSPQLPATTTHPMMIEEPV